jgi:hypothetical protein
MNILNFTMGKFQFILLLLCTVTSAFAQPTLTERIYLSGTDVDHQRQWDFFITEGRRSGQWDSIGVPSNWELEGFGTYNYGHDWRDRPETLGKEVGKYRHDFFVPREWRGERIVRLVFEGAMTDTEVRINGRPAGPPHRGGFYRFGYDITDLVEYGMDNTLEVDVAKHSANASVNAAERQADYWIFGGIFRPVYLEVHPLEYLTQVLIDARADGTLRLKAQRNTATEAASLTAQLLTMEGVPVGPVLRQSFPDSVLELSALYPDIQTWHPEHPHRYRLRVRLVWENDVLYETEAQLGFRTVEIRPRDGLYLNGHKLILKGINRHSFRPETGRALGERDHRADLELLQEMNMNAVRMSHYPPDPRFLELCDSLGFVVLDEVAGWQDGYDTIVGPKVIRSTVLRDHNHPSVLLWDHGNEGGWTLANEPYFKRYDYQQRPVLYPWALRNGIDTRHYPDYNFGVPRFDTGRDVFMPTELLHGLFDGGHGAGLRDFWDSYRNNPAFAGAFLWVLRDEAVLRTDRHPPVYDAAGTYAPDGIVGPHNEKEGSFYAVREIWSPVQIPPTQINRRFDGRLLVRNEFTLANLADCTFRWRLLDTGVPGVSLARVLDQGERPGPDAAPGEQRFLQLDLGPRFATAEILEVDAIDPRGNRVYTWSWPVIEPVIKSDAIRQARAEAPAAITLQQNKLVWRLVWGDLQVGFSRSDGQLVDVLFNKQDVPFAGGPRIVGTEAAAIDSVWLDRTAADGSVAVHTRYAGYPYAHTWRLHTDGWLELTAAPPRLRADDLDYFGISFDYSESSVRSAEWLGAGPYRIWKNRRAGTSFGRWSKDYNDTRTGHNFDNLIYPEFKGYHGNLYWLELFGDSYRITVLNETPGLDFRLFTPAVPEPTQGHTHPPFPAGDVSILYAIPPIGTKFRRPEELGPSGQRYDSHYNTGHAAEPMRLWFRFSLVR